jgi:hypothetical protein
MKDKQTQAGKGDAPRPINLKKYGERYDFIFRKKTNKSVKKKVG